MKISDKEIQVLEKQVSPLVKQAGSYKIDSIGSVDRASIFLREVKGAEDNLEAKRLEFTVPLNQSLKAINETFKQLKSPLTEARILLTEKILTWKRVETEKLDKEEARRRAIQEAHDRKGHKVSATIILKKPENKIGNTQTRKVWTSKVVDFSKVSDRYKSLDQIAVNQAIRDGIREIEGIKIYQEERLSIVRR